MHRRNFLLFTAALTAACVRERREIDSRVALDPSQPLGLPGIDPQEPFLTGLSRAKQQGKPLLVLIVPSDSGQAWQRGQTLGALLNHGDEQVLEALALCEVVCATVEEVRESIAAPADEPWMLLVETASATPYAVALDGTLPPAPESSGRYDSDSANDGARQALDFVSNLLLQGVAPDETTLRRRAAESRAAFGDPKLDPLLTASTPELDHAFAGALLGLALDGALDRAVVRQRLASAAIERVRRIPPPGAQWARSTGCGCEVEGESQDERMMVLCGMGFVPELEHRFLKFFA